MKATTYEEQANKFINETGVKIEISFSHNGKHFADDKENRDVYNVKISREKRSFSFNFGQSLNNSGFYYTIGKQKIKIDRKFLLHENKSYLLGHIRRESGGMFLNNGKSDYIHYPVAPSNYSILACLTKYDPETFELFCSEYGYNEDSRTAERIYRAVCEEWLNVCKIWNDEEIEKLREIQ